LQIPLDQKVTVIQDIPYTISFVVRKNIQIDNLAELPKAKRPPDKMIWDGGGDELTEWLDNIWNDKKQNIVEFMIDEDDIG
jgi:hypothetical protein